MALPTRFMSLKDLKAHGRLPRYGGDKDFKHPVTGQPNANLCRPRESFDASKTIFVFVSHRWLRPSWEPPAAGHPDDEENRKYKLILAALEYLCGKNAPIPEGMEVAVWVDFSCIDQDGAPASELDNLGNLIAGCDLILTPVVWTSTTRPGTIPRRGATTLRCTRRRAGRSTGRGAGAASRRCWRPSSAEGENRLLIREVQERQGAPRINFFLQCS